MPAMPEWMLSNEKQRKLHTEALETAFITEIDDSTTQGGTESESAGSLPSDFMERTMSMKEGLTDSLPVDLDPQTKEPMNEAIQCTVEACSMVLLHPAKTNKASEWTLECVTLLLVDRYISGNAGTQDDKESEKAARDNHATDVIPPHSTLHTLVEGITKCSESNIEGIQVAVVRAMLAIMTSPKCGIHEATLLMCIRATFHVYLITKALECKKHSRLALMDMMQSVFNRMEAYDAMFRSEKPMEVVQHTLSGTNIHGNITHHENGFENGEKKDLSRFASQFHTDGYLLFRALCKLSSKPLPGDENKTSTVISFVGSTPVDPLALNSKILSLELLAAVLEYCGNAFRTGDKFIYAVQNYLCVSLLKNCMSNNTQVAYLSQKIFLILVYKFKVHLKSEIEVFMSNIFLRVLESPNSSFEQKALVLEALRSLCIDPVLLTQIFLNYDCDFDAVNLYKEIVHNLTKLSGKATSQQTSNLTKKEIEQDFELSLAGVEVLVTILKAFLNALGLPGGDEDPDEDSATSRLRGLLQIDVGLAAKPPVTKHNQLNISQADESFSAGDFQPSTSSESSNVAGKIVNAFESKRAAEQNFELGTVKFALSLKDGLKYFIDNGFVDLDAKAIALFFIENKNKLDKTMIGEALGREPDAAFVKDKGLDPEKGGPGFFFRILNHYADSFQFAGLVFDDAIRQFQSGFRLPGEAQKIDRIMEKFAERFTRQNFDVFPSADTAFILAFSIIMLNTDLHSPNIKEEKKMTLDSFIRNNRGIADGADLPKEYLTGIFTRIKASPFSLKEDDEARERAKEADLLDNSIFFEGPSFFGSSAEDRRKEKFKKEREEMMNATELLFKKRKSRTVSANVQMTDSIAPSDVVKPMFDVTWGPLIGTLSQVLECSNDERSIAVCLNGFVYAVRIAAHSEMSLARDTFVNSLGKFTFLGSIKEMRHKNIESIRTLLSIAVIDGEYLNESWGPVLQCISQLARLRLFASGLESDESFLADESDRGRVAALDAQEMALSNASYFHQPTKAEINRETEEGNSRAVVAALNEVLIDKVFSSTVTLSARSIAHFIEQLVEVSATEIAGNSKRSIAGVGSSTKILVDGKIRIDSFSDGDDGPRIFSLQRLVEVADFNMDVRPRLAWAQVWEIMAEHFAKIGCNKNSMVSIFAIDSLKQLSFKFLEKPERSEFNFQRIFLRPYLQIIENPLTREDIRELILRCVDNMIRTKSHNLRSGWKIFFTILTRSASDPSERINTLGLAILQRLLDEHLHQLCRLADAEEMDDAEHADGNEKEISTLETRNRNANVEDFVGLCRASLSFVQTSKSTSPLPIGLSMRALCHTACYADLLADHRVLPPVSGAQSIDPNGQGYTYEGLCDDEALEMVLWRSLLDGLAEGIKSTLPSNAGGVGCLVQRGSVLALRAILLRHGHLFSTSQWVVIMDQTILPALQTAAENDVSPVVSILSESPTISSLDFLAEPQRLPPPHDDRGLVMFAQQAQNAESSPSRPLGKAELLVEASFTDMRHGGDGNLSRAYELAKKDMQAKMGEQPFPDSWVATTAPIALGMMTDIGSEIAMKRGASGRETLWPRILKIFQLWAIGRPSKGGSVTGDGDDTWQPCEALVRIACKEFHRFPLRILVEMPILRDDEGTAWAASVFDSISDSLMKIVSIETRIHEELLRLKLKAYGIAGDDEDEEDEGEIPVVEVILYTPYGKGKLVGKRNDVYKLVDGNYVTTTINIIELEFGGALYRPAAGSTKHHSAPTVKSTKKSKLSENRQGSEFIPKSAPLELTKETWWQKLVPSLKVRCVAVYCLQHYLYDLTRSFLPYADKEVVSRLLEALNKSRIMSAKACSDEDLSHAFQEAMISEWGDGVEEVEEAMANTGRMTQRRGSAMFFLTQDSCATNNIIHMLAIMYQTPDNEGSVRWKRERFAEPFLLERMLEVLEKFLDSEVRDGHLIDPNVWHNASESGGKLAIYCTSFAKVVVNVLTVMLKFSPKQFQRHKQRFFPILCSLVGVQSDEIRHLVANVFMNQIGPIIG